MIKLTTPVTNLKMLCLSELLTSELGPEDGVSQFTEMEVTDQIVLINKLFTFYSRIINFIKETENDDSQFPCELLDGGISKVCNECREIFSFLLRKMKGLHEIIKYDPKYVFTTEDIKTYYIYLDSIIESMFEKNPTTENQNISIQ